MRLISVRVRGSSSTTKTRRGCSFDDVDNVGRALEGEEDEVCGGLGVGVIDSGDTTSLELGALGELTWAEGDLDTSGGINGDDGCPGRLDGDKLSVPTAVSLDRLSNECGRFIDRGRSRIGGVFMPGVSTLECMSAG